MKKWKCTFWRSNPQLAHGGYETVRFVEARTEASAKRKAEKEYGDCGYGAMWLLRVELAE